MYVCTVTSNAGTQWALSKSVRGLCQYIYRNPFVYTVSVFIIKGEGSHFVFVFVYNTLTK
jgi:hypothetical protein